LENGVLETRCTRQGDEPEPEPEEPPTPPPAAEESSSAAGTIVALVILSLVLLGAAFALRRLINARQAAKQAYLISVAQIKNRQPQTQKQREAPYLCRCGTMVDRGSRFCKSCGLLSRWVLDERAAALALQDKDTDTLGDKPKAGAAVAGEPLAGEAAADSPKPSSGLARAVSTFQRLLGAAKDKAKALCAQVSALFGRLRQKLRKTQAVHPNVEVAVEPAPIGVELSAPNPEPLSEGPSEPDGP
jgi:hypothetical protein